MQHSTEIVEAALADGDCSIRDYILVGSGASMTICRVSPVGELVAILIEDDSLNQDCIAFLEAQEVRQFTSLSDAIADVIKKKTEPNKAMEPTPVNVTIPADAGLAPFTSVAHL